MNPSPSLRSRIAHAFNDEELRAFCFDHFPAVSNELTTGMTKGQIIHLLLDYCARRRAGDMLLTALEQERPSLISEDRDVLLAWLGSVCSDATHSRDNLTAALHQLRAPLGDFVGRAAEIAQLTEAVRRAVGSGAVAAISGVRGMGGIGKTELAYMIAHQLAGDFPDAQIVLDLRGASDLPLTPTQALQILIRAFEPEVRLPDDLMELQSRYRSLLTGKRALILADDAHVSAQVRWLLPPPGCVLLVTSRLRFTLPGMLAIDLGTLEPTEAEALLLTICPRIGEAASTLAKLCGYLPLALRISAGLLASDATLSLTCYLEQLADERTRLAALRDFDDPALDVEAVLALSYAALSPVVQIALCQLSLFVVDFDLLAAQTVVTLESRRIVDDGQDKPDWSLSYLWRGSAYGESVTGVLGSLYRRSLLDYDAALERYSLHDLVRVFAYMRLDVDVTRLFMLRYAQHYAQIAKQADDLYLQGGESVLVGLALFDRERAHIDAGWAWVRGQDAKPAIDNLLIAYAVATASISELRYDVRQQRIPQLQAACTAAQRCGRRAAQSIVLNNLGLAYADVGELRHAINYHQQRLVLARKLHDRRGEGQTLGNLGNAYAKLGEVRRAIEFYEQQLEIAHEAEDRRGEGNALGNLGLAYAALGEVQWAISYYEQSLEIAREVGDRRSEGRVLGNLGIAYKNLGEAERAIEYYEQQLVIARTIGDQRGEGITLGNLGIAYKNLGQVQRAIDSYEQQLVITRAIGDQHGEALGSWNLGRLLAEQGEVARAIALMQLRVDYELSIGHADAEGHAAYVAELRQKLQAAEATASPEPDTPHAEPQPSPPATPRLTE